MTGSAAIPAPRPSPSGYIHDALLYDSTDELAAAAVPFNALNPNGGNQQLDDIELVDLSEVEKEKRPCRVKVPVDLSWLV